MTTISTRESDPLLNIGTIDVLTTTDVLKKRIAILSERAWEYRITWDNVERWLKNFNGAKLGTQEEEQLHALYLLSQFTYFGSKEIRVLLRALFRDLYLCPLIQEIRQALGDTRDVTLISKSLAQAMSSTRFLGVGNPSESGAHLLYYFRQENDLSKDNFIDTAQILKRSTTHSGQEIFELRYPDVSRYVFVDDLCGSGETALRYSNDFLKEVIKINPKAKLYYFALFATSDGLKRVREKTLFGDNSGAVYELDSSYKCLSVESRYLKAVPSEIKTSSIIDLVRHYGSQIWPESSTGYADSQLLLGFHHNTPDNTIPVFWMDGTNDAAIPWTAIFKRYPKL